jgi:membrane protein required for beta-lactamase induction
MVVMNKKIIIIVAILILSLLLTLFIKPTDMNLLLEKLVFNAVSILVGLSIAVVGIFLGSINSMYLSIYKIIKTKNQTILTEKEIVKMKTGLSEIVDELKDNAIFSLFCFIAVLIFFFLKAVDLPYIHWFIDGNFYTKEFFLNLFILVGNFLIFYAIIDSIFVVFRITKAFELMKEEE